MNFFIANAAMPAIAAMPIWLDSIPPPVPPPL
jgi:hypothetical protein